MATEGARGRSRYPALCLLLLVAWWAILAIEPRYRTSWLHENLLVFVAVPSVAWLHLRIRFDHVSVTLLTLFFALHLVGAHYTYSEVPLFDRLKEWGGYERNHYDRVIHFGFGLLLAYPMRELFVRAARTRGFWSYFFPVTLVMALSMLYELIEWWFVLLVDPAAGTAFLGAQGDVWDAQKDMALASAGAVLAMATTLLVHLRTQPAFRQSFRDSLRVEPPEE